MSIQTNTYGDIFTVQPTGEINLQASVEFETLLNMAIEDGLKKVIFDFSKTSHISSDGLHVVLKIIRVLSIKKGIVIVAAMSVSVRSVFEASGFLTLIDEFENVEEAVNALINDDEK